MEATQLKTKKAVNVWFAKADEQDYSKKYKHTHSEAHKAQAHKMRSDLFTMYNTAQVYINFRAKFIAIKVDAPATINDAALHTLREAEWKAAGVTKATSKQGVIYRIAL